MSHDLSPDVHAVCSEIQAACSRVLIGLDAARDETSVPADIGRLLEEIAGKAQVLVNAYTPSDDVSEVQPVAYDETSSGWDFDPWMNEKSNGISASSQNALEMWKEIVEAVEQGTYSWSDLYKPFDRTNLGDTPVNRREYLEFCVSNANRLSTAISEMVATRLTATSPGRGGRPTPPIQ